MSTQVLGERKRELDRAYEEEGAAGPLAGPDTGKWRCDPVPFLFTETEFAALTGKLAQRATLLEHLLADIYGPQTLLAQAILPPTLVYPNAAYLRPCRTAMPGRHLHLYAADLFRAPDGAWRVLADRTGETSGLAYALENRRMMARALPELFRAVEVASLRPFFDAWQDALQRLAPAGAGNPGLAVLTPGHDDPRWFEHVVLARELGCALVEDGDLTLRDGLVWVKTLLGLSPLHVLLRCQSGTTIDPLELGGDVGNGIPGLFRAMRDGAVKVLNGPGSAFAQAPGLAPFLPGICRHLLGEELSLQSAEALWLGDATARARVQSAPAAWRVLSAYDGSDPTAAALAEQPWALAALATPSPSFTPFVGAADVLEPHGVVVRLFLMFDGTDWRALQGGVARLADAGHAAPGKLPAQGVAKDVWVLVEEGTDIVGPGNLSVPALPVRRTSGDLPSRVADNFYWFGRYLERLENAARLSRSVLVRLSRTGLLPRDMPDLVALCACLAEAGLVSPDIGAAAGTVILTEQLRGAMAGDKGALARLTGNVQSLADALRDRLSGEMHGMIAHGMRGLKGARLALAPGVRGTRVASLGLLADFAGRILEFCATVSGYAAENMVRGGGHLFLDLGRRIERSQTVCLHLAMVLDQKPERIEAGLGLALELCDSTLTYRSRYLSVKQPATVLDLVLADEGNPRSLGFQLAAARGMLAELGRPDDTGLAVALDAPIAAMRRMLTELQEAEDHAVCAAALSPRLRAIGAQIATISIALSRQYFTLLPVTGT